MTLVPVAIDGSDGPLAARRVALWRRLEPGDVRTPGTEVAPESEHLEVKVLEVGIDAELASELAKLWARRDELTRAVTSWTTRYEPAGAVFALGCGMLVGVALDYLPSSLLSFSGSLVILGSAFGVFTKVNFDKAERRAARAWRDAPEREELDRIERTLKEGWKRFAEEQKELGFRTEVRVGDIHEAERLVSMDLARITHPKTWAPDGEDEVRYGWAYGDGRVVEKVAELEDAEVEEPDDAEPDDAEPDDAEPDDAEPEDAEPDDAEPDDAEPDDAEPEDAEPEDAEPEPDASPADDG